MTIASESPRVVVTGAGSGIGRAFALEVARRRGSVLCSDVNLKGAEETAQLVEKAGGKAAATLCDVTKLEDVARLADEAKARIGGVDVVVNNAGVGIGGAVGDIPIEDWRWAVDINLWGVIYGCHVFVPLLKAQGGGHVINVASAAGIVAGPKMGPYNVTKAGVIALSETLSTELHGTGVGVTVLCPTFIQTNILNAMRGNDPKGKAMAQKLMDRGSHTADDVARETMAAAAKDQLYVLPQQDAKWMWRLKRADPSRFYKVLAPRIAKFVDNKKGLDLKSLAKEIFS